MRKTTVKEVKKWMRTLEENRYKKTYASDARRVSWLVNNNLSEDYEAMPISMKKKWPKAAYKRERFLAKEYVKHQRKLAKEAKQKIKERNATEAKLRESIRKIVVGIINEQTIITEDKITFEDTMDAYGFESAGGDAGVKFYVNNKAKLDAWVMGSKMANVGRMSGKDNKIFKNPMKMGDHLERKFKLKNKHLDD